MPLIRYTLLKVLHEFAEEDKGKELAFRNFKPPPPIDAEDAEVSLLHMIFDLKGVLVGKDYFRTNRFLPLSFNLIQGRTLLGKSVVPKPILKEFLFRCLE